MRFLLCLLLVHVALVGADSSEARLIEDEEGNDFAEKMEDHSGFEVWLLIVSICQFEAICCCCSLPVWTSS